MQFGILGPLEVRRGGEPVALGAAKQRALLARLLLQPGEVVPVDRLIEDLWGDATPRTAAHTVQVYVSALRKALGRDAVARRAGGYAASVASECVDAHRFEQLCARAASSEPREARRLLGEALALWRGPPLADFRYDSFAQATIARLEEQRISAVEDRIDADLALGGGTELVGELQQLVAEHPLRERLRGQLMLALYRGGRHADALATYQAFRTLIGEELGLDPSAELKELERRILQQDSDLAVGAPERLPVGTVTFVATDIEGSTRLLQRLGDRYAEVLEEHRRIVSEALASHGGNEVDAQGDSALLAFPRANDAVRAAAEIQRRLAAANWPNGEQVLVRMGIHTGEPTLTGGRYVGLDVHRVARVCAAAYGGQVVVSGEARDLVEALPDGLRLVDLGQHRLRDLEEPRRLYQLDVDGLPAEFPPLKSLNQTNLPVQTTNLIGREDELGEVVMLVRTNPLVTLTGAGGSGKTRLALQAAAELLDEFPDGIWFVSLASVEDASLVEPTIMSTVGGKGDAVAFVRGKRMLLVLDNLEQLLPEVATVVAELGGNVLATSRERLNLAGEQEFPVPPLALDDAVVLFTARARRLKPAFQPDEHVAEIAQRLDGLPLALELAAARVKVLTPARIADRLSPGLDLLTGGTRDAPERQRTLRATIQWSFELLTSREQQLLSRLGTFAGSIDLEAAEAVADADLDTLASLVDKSLVHQTESGRFFLLETIREFTRAVRVSGVDSSETQRRHAHFFLGLGVTAQADMEAWLERLDQELPNLRQALAFLRDDDPAAELELAVAISELFRLRGLSGEGRLWLDDALGRAETLGPLYLRGLEDVAYFAYQARDLDVAEERVRELRRLAEAQRDGAAGARASHLAGLVDVIRGDFLTGRASLLEAIAVFGEDSYAAFSYVALAYVALVLDDTVEARAYVQNAFDVAGDSHEHLAGGLALLATAALLDDDEAEAARLLLENLEQEEFLGLTPYFASQSLEIAASLAAVQGAFVAAARLVGAAEALRERSGTPELGPLFRRLHDDTRSKLSVELGTDRLAAEWERGRDLSDAEALALTRSTVNETAGIVP